MKNKDLFLEKMDYRYLEWDKIRSSSGTAGSFLKATENKAGRKIYYKLSNFDSLNGIIGHECINEIIASRLLDLLGIEHLQYRLLYGTVVIDGIEYDTYICASDSFRNKNERKITWEDYYNLNKKDNELQFEFAKRMGFDKEIYQMILVDFLILNRDRHGANIETIMDKKLNIRMAPLFDHGLSLLFNCFDEESVANYDVMEDKPVQSFIGSHSAEQNLKLLPHNLSLAERKLCESDREYLFDGLYGIISDKNIDKIWDMIWKRWKYYESLYNL